jgi:hypothetical protein
MQLLESWIAAIVDETTNEPRPISAPTTKARSTQVVGSAFRTRARYLGNGVAGTVSADPVTQRTASGEEVAERAVRYRVDRPDRPTYARETRLCRSLAIGASERRGSR